MFSNQKYLTVRLTSFSTSKVLKYGKKVSGKAINECLKNEPHMEFIDAATGQYLNINDAKQMGVIYLNVRYNDDRNIHVIKI